MPRYPIRPPENWREGLDPKVREVLLMDRETAEEQVLRRNAISALTRAQESELEAAQRWQECELIKLMTEGSAEDRDAAGERHAAAAVARFLKKGQPQKRAALPSAMADLEARRAAGLDHGDVGIDPENFA